MTKKRSTRGNIAEFASTLIVLLLFVIYPLINLLFIGCDMASLALITTQAASAASLQAGHQNALTAMQTELTKLSSSGFSKMAHLSQSGGYQNCGANLYIVETNLQNGATAYYGPNTPYALPANSQNFIYEYKVVSTFQVAPFISMSGVPFIGKVPLIGQPATLTWSAERVVENVAGGVAGTATGGGAGGGAGGSGSGSTPGGSGAAAAGGTSTPGGSGTAGAQPSGCVI